MVEFADVVEIVELADVVELPDVVEFADVVELADAVALTQKRTGSESVRPSFDAASKQYISRIGKSVARVKRK